MFVRLALPIFATLLLLPLLAGCGGGKAKKPASSLSASDKAAVVLYEEVRIALAEDDMRKARFAADRLLKAMETSGVSAGLVKVAAATKAISETARIDTMRSAFKDVSAAVIKVAGEVEGYYVFDSPMIVEGRWLQTTPTPMNPFLGRALSTLGNPVVDVSGPPSTAISPSPAAASKPK